MNWANPTESGYEYWYLRTNYTFYLRRTIRSDQWHIYNHKHSLMEEGPFTDLNEAKVALLIKLALT